MTFPRALWADLREKRLWPLAVLLVVGLVAIPFVLPKLSSGDQAMAPLPVAPPNVVAPNTKQPALTVVDQVPARKPAGRYDDPFRGGPKGVATASAAHAKSPAKASSGATAAGAGAKASSPKPVHAAPAPSATPSPAATPAPTIAASAPSAGTNVGTKITHHARRAPAGMRVDVTWGRTGAAKQIPDLVRLGQLKGAGVPVALLFGVRGDRETAVFLLPHDVTAVGDGTCLPSPDDCQLLELKAGDAEFFDVAHDGGVSQYELDVDSVARRMAATAAKARALRHRQSKLGRKVMYTAISAGRDASTDFMYKSHFGVLIRQLPGR